MGKGCTVGKGDLLEPEQMRQIKKRVAIRFWLFTEQLCVARNRCQHREQAACTIERVEGVFVKRRYDELLRILTLGKDRKLRRV